MTRSVQCALASLLLLGVSASIAGAQSTMFRGDPGHTGVSAAPLFAGQGGIMWRRPLGGAVRSSPAVTATRIFVGAGDSLYAIDRLTGRVVWAFGAGDPVTASPALAGDRVIAATLGGRIFAVDQRSGRVRWSRRTGKALPLNTTPAGGWDYFASSALVADGAVVVGGADGLVYALDPRTGATRWTAPTGGRVRATPALSGGAAVVGSWDGRLYALDLATGRERWVHRTVGDTLDSHRFGFDRRAIQSSAAVGEGLVFFGSRDGGVYALDAATGERRWRVSHHGSWVVGSPAVRDGTLYVGSSDGQFIHALRVTDGAERWRVGTGANVLSSPLLAGDLLVVGTGANEARWGELLALDATTGRPRWRLRLTEAVYGSPVAFEDQVYVGTDGGELLAIGEISPAAPRLAVYYDGVLAARGRMPGARLAREYFADLGYEVLSGDSLRAFLLARIADHVPSVVVFALDVIPDAVRADTGAAGVWQRYLDAGGKIIWLGPLPGSLVFDSSGAPLGHDLAAAGPLTGLPVDSTDWDENPSRPTQEGRRWGLELPGRADMPTSPAVVTRVLALDSEGRATAWQTSYDADRPWSGYVQLWGFGASAERLPEIRAAAEYGLLRRFASPGGTACAGTGGPRPCQRRSSTSR